MKVKILLIIGRSRPVEICSRKVIYTDLYPINGLTIIYVPPTIWVVHSEPLVYYTYIDVCVIASDVINCLE